MPQFDLNSYETVEERLKRFYKDNPDGRVITKNITTLQDRQVSTWVVQAEIWLPAWKLDKAAKDWFVVDRDSQPWYLKATGLAFEIDGQGMANKTSALENAETSAIGRALANAGYSGNKRTSRTEMEKVAKGKTPVAPVKDWLVMAQSMGDDLDGLRLLYSEAKTANAPKETLDRIAEIANGSSGAEHPDRKLDRNTGVLK
jgi:hypothetical protein